MVYVLAYIAYVAVLSLLSSAIGIFLIWLFDWRRDMTLRELCSYIFGRDTRY